ncbi:diaminopimelate decarboxylase family protein [Singulisphaera sp. PoT]|uniref:diaminopimelate decarboxylase family protein n=1 Tax=Singulisphaera sp. PoT TaxID=3411797 RepID=UPI003BF49A27
MDHFHISTGEEESKFGTDVDRSPALAEQVAKIPAVTMIGMRMHIDSQVATVDLHGVATAKWGELIAQMRKMGHPIAWYSVGGGLGIDDRGLEAMPIAGVTKVILPEIKAAGCRLAMEPARPIGGNAGILASRVLYTKQSGEKRFLIRDAAMNDPIRPALHRESSRRVRPVDVPAGLPAPPADSEAEIVGTEPRDVVGQARESGEFPAKDRALPRLDRGTLLANFSAGAYGMVMASNDNTRPRAAEVLVDGTALHPVRRRETYEDSVLQEHVGI